MTVSEPTTAESWAQANHRYLLTEIERLRLLLKRRVLWLRQQWKPDTLQSFQGFIVSDARADWLLSSEDRAAENHFYRENTDAINLTASISSIDRELDSQRRALEAAGESPALEVLAHLFDLTPFSRSVVLLCFASMIDPRFERLYAYAQDDVSLKHATIHLALTLFGGEGEAWLNARESLLPSETLRRCQLVRLETSAPLASTHENYPLILDQRVANYILGINRLDEQIVDFLLPISASLVAPRQSHLLEGMQRWFASTSDLEPWPAFNLVGAPGAGGQELARAFCERLGLQLYGLNLPRLPTSNPDRLQALQLLEREAVLLQFALYIDLSSSTTLPNGIEHLRVLVFIGSTRFIQAPRKMMPVHVPRLSAYDQKALWRQALNGTANSLEESIESIIQHFDLSSGAISQIADAARSRACLHSNQDVTEDILWQACHEVTDLSLQELAQQIFPCHTWEDIILPEDVYDQLKEIAAQVSHRTKVYEVWGFGQKLNHGRGISALFAGPSGTGKTLAAEVLANHLRLGLHRIDLSGVVSKYIGETEKNLRRVFDAAEGGGAILFFDEADALFGKRSEVKDSHDRYANIEVNYLLQRIEDYRGLAILATNMKSHLDPAFLRRLRFLVDFPFPDTVHRAQIWRQMFPPQAETEDLDYDFLSRLEISGGNIRNIALNAAFLAAEAGDPIRMDHLIRAARREYVKIEKIISPTLGPSRPGMQE